MTESTLAALDRFASLRVGVVGDFLLDRYIVGNTARVSREAPIVVVDYDRTVDHPGGAANAAQNIAALGGRAEAVGVLGGDEEGRALRSLLEARGVDTAGLVTDADSPTSTKLRILAGELNAQKQQVARVDRSHRHDSGVARRDDLRAALERVVSRCDAVLISDYGMGLVTGGVGEWVIARGRERGVPVVIDSRFDLPAFSGATVATPNEVEALDVLGASGSPEPNPAELARGLRAATGIDAFIVTRGSRGMLVCEPDGDTHPVGVVGSDEATDVTGAGDTVSAVVALSLAGGASLLEAARMATYAAAVVVMKRGTATASPDEIRACVRAEVRGT